ncbi:DUF2268 domain-containing putative Zn-dependent protease [Fictibacillus nanhaiensis]
MSASWSFIAGYAVGYEVVKSFMKNKTIFEITLISSDDIIKG